MADEHEGFRVKCLQSFGPVRPLHQTVIKILTLKKGRTGFLVSTGNEFLYLIEKEKVSGIFHFPSAVICICVEGDRNHSSSKLMTILTSSGRVYTVPISRSKAKSKSRASTNTLPSKGTTSNQGIFSDLLSEPGTTTDNNDIGKSSSDVTRIMLQQAVIYEPGGVDLVIWGENIAIFGNVDGECFISIHSKSQQTHVPETGGTPYYSLQTRTVCTKALLGNKSQCQDTFMHAREAGIITYVQSEGGPNASSCLVRDIFGELFGRTLLLINSPVLLFGFPSGVILFKSLVSDLTFDNNNVTKEIYNQNILYHLEESIILLDLARVHITDSVKQSSNEATSGGLQENCGQYPECFNAIAILGSRGKLVLCCKGFSESQGCDFLEHNLPGPVICASINKSGDTLVHSNRNEIFLTKLDFTCNGKIQLPRILIPQVFPVPRICALQFVFRTRTESLSVIAFNSKGKLLELLLDDPQKSSSCTPPDVLGQQLKDLLSAIETTSQDIAQCRGTLMAQDNVLKALNTTANLACKLEQEQRESAEKFMSLDIQPQRDFYYSAGTSQACFLIKIANNSGLNLTSDWSLLIKVNGTKNWPCSLGNSFITIAHSFSVDAFLSKATREFKISLENDISTCSPIMVEGYLHFDCKRVLSRLPHDPASTFLRYQDGFLISLGTFEFDVLDFAFPSPSGKFPCMQPEIGELLEALKAVNSQETAVHLEDQQGSFTASLKLSEKCTMYMASQLETKLETNSTSLEDSALLFLFDQCPHIRSMIDRDSSMVSLRTPDGYVMSVHVKCLPSTHGDTVDGGGITVELTLQAASLLLLCKLHSAVVARFKAAAIRPGERCSSSRWDLHRTLGTVKGIQNQLVGLEDALTRSRQAGQNNEEKLARRLAELYIELRQVSLFIQ